MSFKKKIDMILEARKLQKLTKNKIEKLIDVDGTIYKAYDDDREPADLEIVRKLIERLGIRQEWWDKEWETGSMDIFNTSVQKRSDNTGNNLNESLDEMLEKVESSRDYFVIPRAVLKENYRLVALEQFELEKQKLEKERADMLAQREKDRVYMEAQIEANRDLSRKLDLLMSKLADVQKS